MAEPLVSLKRLAKRVKTLKPSGTLSVIEHIASLKRDGLDVLTFSDRPAVPAGAIERADEALHEQWSSFYTDTRGIRELREAIAKKMSVPLGRPIDPDTQVLVTVGAKEAIFDFMLSTLDSADEVLLPDPAWVSYEPSVRLAGGVVRRVPLAYSTDGFRVDAELLRRSISARSKAIVLNTPQNPTGMVASVAELQEVADAALGADLFVLADECYADYVYDGSEHRSIASIPGMFARTITVSTVSKAFNMFGWRVGWAVGPEQLITRLLSVHQHITACATSFAQAGAIAAIELGHSSVERAVEQYGNSRNLIVKSLNEIEGISCHLPQGGYAVFPNVRGLGCPSAEVVHRLLVRGRVETFPGNLFGPSGEGFLRINFSCGLADIEEGMARIRSALA